MLTPQRVDYVIYSLRLRLSRAFQVEPNKDVEYATIYRLRFPSSFNQSEKRTYEILTSH